MLTGAVDTGEGLFVEQAHQSVAGGHLLQHLHGQLVLVAGSVGISIDGSQLMLGGSHLVVLRLGQYTQLPQLLIQLPHERGHAGLDGAVIVVVQLLTLGRLGAEQRPTAQLQVLAALVGALVDEKILLLGAHLGRDMLDLRVAKQPQDADACAVQLPHRAQQGGLLIQRLAAVRAEDGGDVQGVVLHEGVGGGVPGRVASGLKGGPQAAGGEAGGIGLTLVQLLGAQLHPHAVLAVAGDEAVVLLGGEAGHGLKPVGVVGGALFNGPVLHRAGDLAGYGTIQRRSLCQ